MSNTITPTVFYRTLTSFGALNFSDETILHKAILLTWRHV